MLLLTSLRHQDYALLNYRAIHPEICEKPKKIIPTCGHYRGLFRMLKRHMDNYSHEKYINDNQACLDEILANEYTQQDFFSFPRKELKGWKYETNNRYNSHKCCQNSK